MSISIDIFDLQVTRVKSEKKKNKHLYHGNDYKSITCTYYALSLLHYEKKV